MLITIMVEIVDFCEAAFGESFTCYLFVIIERFIDRNSPRSLFVPLLPARALGKFEEIHEIMRCKKKDEFLDYLTTLPGASLKT